MVSIVFPIPHPFSHLYYGLAQCHRRSANQTLRSSALAMALSHSHSLSVLSAAALRANISCL